MPMARESGAWEGKIESLSNEGLGVGTALVQEGGKTLRRPVFIPFAAPGDVILANVTDQKRKYLFGEIDAVLKPSPQRTEPVCPHFMVCGGCNLQHVSYEEQLRQKGKQIAYFAQRKGVQLPEEVRVLPSKERHHYRWRSRIAIRFEGRCIAGFRKHQSNEIVPVSTCFIVHQSLVELISLMNEAQTDIASGEIEVVAVVGQRGKVGVLVPLDALARESRQAVRDFFEQLYARNRQVIGNVLFAEDGQTRTYGQVQEHFTYETAGMTFSFLPETFIQANVATNEVLVATALELIFGEALAEREVVLDLYAGIGNLSLPIAKRARAVVAVEGNEQAVQQGIANALRNGVKNATFIHSPVERYLRELVRKKGTHPHYPAASSIVLDPPRTGLTEAVMRELLHVGARRLLYVSCNPVTLADDLFVLHKAYAVRRVIGIDMFPDTSHVEALVLLEKR
jgi:23S rRNA (uracil1939-C5)-methyltransferase